MDLATPTFVAGLGREVAEQCEETRTKQDLLAYLQRIALYCHQLNICSKVRVMLTLIGEQYHDIK